MHLFRDTPTNQFGYDPTKKEETLEKLIPALVEAQQWEAALRWVQEMTYKSTGLEVLVKGLAQAGQLEQAAHLASEITGDEPRARTLTELSIALSLAQQVDQAATLLNEAEGIVLDIEPQWMRPEILIEMGKRLFQAQQHEQAVAILTRAEEQGRITTPEGNRINVLSELVHIFAQQGMREHAQAIIREPTHEAQSAGPVNTAIPAMQVALAEELGKIQSWDEAEATIRRIKENTYAQNGAWATLGSFLHQVGLWEPADAAIHSIKDDTARAKALFELVHAYIKAGRKQQAEALCPEIEEIIHTIKKYETRVEMQKELLIVLESLKSYQQMLHLVQQAWLKADSRENAIKLLPFASTIVARNPEISTPLCNAFDWVENFLKG